MMDSSLATCLDLRHTTYENVVNCLEAISNKSVLKVLKLFETPICKLNNQILNDFRFLIEINLSNCYIYEFENGVFQNAIHLESIDLSNNLIFRVENNLFEMNTKLKTIILKNNLLDDCKITTNSVLEYLEIFDLSYNYISKLEENCLNFPNLKRLHLNYNQIKIVMSRAFEKLPNLTHLLLDHNKLRIVNGIIFNPLISLEYLNLNNNLITYIPPSIFWKLTQLKSLYFKSNLVIQHIRDFYFIFNTKLTDLDLSDNIRITLGKNLFFMCEDVANLNLKIHKCFDVSLVRNLTSLKQFELRLESNEQFSLDSNFWNGFENKQSLTTLTLIFQKVRLISLCDFTNLINLISLHIECENPNKNGCDLKLARIVNRMPKLQKLILKNLNSFIVTEFRLLRNNLNYFDITGVKNGTFENSLFTFKHLKYLNLSFSELGEIGNNVFFYLTNLEHLDLSHTKITSIRSLVFNNNRKLRFLNCSNCLITHIDHFAFRNQSNLSMLDLSNNQFGRKLSPRVLFGLRMESCCIFL